MTDFSVTNYNPYNMYQLYGYNYPSFRGATVPTDSASNQSPQVPQLTQQPDSVQFSASKQIQPEESKGLSKGAKWALGIAGTAAAIYGGVVAHRAITKPSIEKVAKNFSEIFRRDVSKEEAQKLVSNYREIFKTDNAEDFCTKMFEQVKKDYGFGDINIQLQVNKMADTSIASQLSKSSIASYNARDGILKLNPTHFKSGEMAIDDKLEMFEAVIHELQHAKQSEIAYRTDVVKYLEAMQQRSDRTSTNFVPDMIAHCETVLQSKNELTTFMKENKFNTIDETKKYIENLIKTLKEKENSLNGNVKVTINKDEIKQKLDSLWGKLEKFKEGSKEYNLGMKYIDNEANYIHANKNNYEEYRQQLVEAEAFGTEQKVKDVYNHFANIWRMPFFG